MSRFAINILKLEKILKSERNGLLQFCGELLASSSREFKWTASGVINKAKKATVEIRCIQRLTKNNLSVKSPSRNLRLLVRNPTY